MQISENTWQSLPEWEISQVGDEYAIRINTVVDYNKSICVYNDKNITINEIKTCNNLTFGYTISVRQNKFFTLKRKWWLSLLSNVEEHSNPVVVYNDSQIYLYRFNGTKNPSYWLVIRWKTEEDSEE